MLRLVVDYDNHAARELSLQQQVELLMEIDHLKRIDPAAWMISHLDLDKTHILLTNDCIFHTSFRVWNLYRPEFLATLSYDRQAFLAQLGSREKQAAIRYDGIIHSADILPADSRALFCVPRMDGWHWTEGRLFFDHLFETDGLAARINGTVMPTFPITFCPSHFYHFYRSDAYSFDNHLPDALKCAIEDDCPERFAIARSLCGKRMTRKLFLFMLKRDAGEILAENRKALLQHIPVISLVLFCASSVSASAAIRLLRAIEDDAPVTVAGARDIFGNNALWYSLYRSGNIRQEDESCTQALETFLLECGCDPDAPNRLDLTYNSIRKAQKALAEL